MHALSEESLTLVVVLILAELLHLTSLQGVFRDLQDMIGENPLTGNARLVEGKFTCLRSQYLSPGHSQQKSL